MTRYLAAILACLLVTTGLILVWQSRAERPALAAPPEPRLAAMSSPTRLAPIPEAPAADPKSKEEKRFDRADKNRDGRITLAELIEPRRKPFAKLDRDANGTLSFEEWAVRTIDKFEEADDDNSAALTRAEYAATAPKPKAKKAACSC